MGLRSSPRLTEPPSRPPRICPSRFNRASEQKPATGGCKDPSEWLSPLDIFGRAELKAEPGINQSRPWLGSQPRRRHPRTEATLYSVDRYCLGGIGHASGMLPVTSLPRLYKKYSTGVRSRCSSGVYPKRRTIASTGSAPGVCLPLFKIGELPFRAAVTRY